jgi:[ribosomal protein S18]-alanine N-acetyltransferase
MTAVDLPAVEAIQQACPTAAQWPVRDYLDHDSTVCEDLGAVIGFLVVRQVAPGEHEILNLAIAPACRRRGIASLLLTSGWSVRSGTWFLEVRESNNCARNFYKKMGFMEAGRRRAYYEQPAEDCIVMKFQS